ncbi:hypothetical protein EST38_g5413 [Candolleomyces aberdarensis]|uniref:BTB domain-containing protein n=1 Tax=Candolleomyces aberdarensis TaxID=2316362 RepID=A0A4Q2DN76_9AGAR|nr:hypothetical protein EST38_g5413 [Candolleomyces aberdarensis]
MVVLEPNGSSSAKPLKSQNHNNGAGPAPPKPPPYGHPGGTHPDPNVRPYPVAEAYSPNVHRRSPGMRFLKALCVAVLVWMLCGAFIRSLVSAIGWSRDHRGGGWNGGYPIPGGVSLEQCLEPAQWDNALSSPNLLNVEGDSYAANQSAQYSQMLPRSAYPFASKASFELPISSDSLYLLSRGAYASGRVDILTSAAQKQDSAAVHVTVRYYHQEMRDLVKLCKISRRAGDRGVGIFSTRRRSPLRIKNLETDVQNTFHQVHAIAEHVVFGDISLTGSNAHISALNLAADVASVQTSNSAILGTFNASKELSLVTSNGLVKVDVHLDNGSSSTPSKLHIKTSNAPLEANISLYASTSGVKGQYPQYKVDTQTSNNNLQVDFQKSPADSTLYYDGYTSNGPTNVQLHAAYQGSFKVSTSNSWGGPELQVREHVPDPSGRGRKREVQHSSLYKGVLAGSVRWVDDEKEDKKLEKGTVEVENRLFRVPKYRLVSDSEYFANKYALNTSGDSGSEHEYTSVESPQLDAVKLDDVSADEFQSFLKAVYPMVIQGELSLSKEEWLSVLKLSTKWFFNGLRTMATETLTQFSLDPFEKIQLGKEHFIEGWVLAGYRELVMRYEAVTVKEAQMIGLQEAIQLNPIRELWIRQDHPFFSEKHIDKLVQAAFVEDFNFIRNTESQHRTAEEKEEAARALEEHRLEEERIAKREAESERLRIMEVEEQKKLADLMQELEKQRKIVETLRPATNIPKPDVCGFPVPWGGFSDRDASPASSRPPSRCMMEPPPPCPEYVSPGDGEIFKAAVADLRPRSVFVQARGRLFRVPKYRLISESEYFASKYGLDGDSGSEHEYGTVEDPRLNAVKLDDVSADEFRSFLKAVYPKVTHSYLSLAKDDWLSVLKLSTKWLFNDLRKKAIEELSWLSLDPIERIQLGKEFDVEAWLLSGCRDLVSRESVISIEDAEKINWKVAINLYIIRDGVKTEALADAIDDQVRNTFSTDFERIKGSQSMYLSAEERLREVQEEEERKREAEERKKEEEELAIHEAESRRLEALAAEEGRMVAELALELENRRQKLRSIGATHTKPSPITPREPEIAGVPTVYIPDTPVETSGKKKKKGRKNISELEPQPALAEYPECPLNLSKEEWLSVLKLSTEWFFDGFRKRAINNFTSLNLDPVDKVNLGTQLNVSSWIKTGYRELVTRIDITVEDARQVGWGAAIKLYGVRDSWNKMRIPGLGAKIEATFSPELSTGEDLERQHLKAQEKDDQEEDRSTGETHLRAEEDSGQLQEEAPLQKALAVVVKALKEHKVAFEEFREALQPIDANVPRCSYSRENGNLG